MNRTILWGIVISFWLCCFGFGHGLTVPVIMIQSYAIATIVLGYKMEMNYMAPLLLVLLAQLILAYAGFRKPESMLFKIIAVLCIICLVTEHLFVISEIAGAAKGLTTLTSLPFFIFASTGLYHLLKPAIPAEKQKAP